MRAIFFLLCLLASSCSSDDVTDEETTLAKGKRKGKNKKEAVDEPVDVGNGIKIVELRIEPENPTSTDILRVRKQICQAADIDGSGRCTRRSAQQGKTQWMKNGVPISGQITGNLMSEHFQKGDKLSVVLTFPKSEGLRLKEHTSNEITIANTAPEIEPPRNQDIYAAQLSALIKEGRPFPIRASDIDGDDLKFELRGAPSGMSILKTDTTRAEIRYVTGTTIVPGDYDIQVIANDGDNHNTWQFKINLWATGEVKTEEEDGLVAEEGDDAQERKVKADEPIQGLEGADEPDRDWEDDAIEGLEGGNERDAEWEDDSIEGLEYDD